MPKNKKSGDAMCGFKKVGRVDSDTSEGKQSSAEAIRYAKKATSKAK